MRNVHRVKTGEKKFGLLLSGLVVLWPLLFGEMAIAYQEEEVSGGGSITGVVKFTGIVPSPQTYKVTMGSNPNSAGLWPTKMESSPFHRFVCLRNRNWPMSLFFFKR